jgi:streptogramin lyase
LSDASLKTPGALALDASGGLYVADQAQNDIAYFAAGQTAVTATLKSSTFINGINALMFDPNGSLWASLSSANSIERLGAQGLPNTVSVADTIGTPGAMAWVP